MFDILLIGISKNSCILKKRYMDTCLFFLIQAFTFASLIKQTEISFLIYPEWMKKVFFRKLRWLCAEPRLLLPQLVEEDELTWHDGSDQPEPCLDEHKYGTVGFLTRTEASHPAYKLRCRQA